MRILHLADCHLRINSRHDEYREVFTRLFKMAKDQKVDRIVIAGDLVHSKITMSPELISLMEFFLNGLRKVAPVDIIPGNHDLNMSNKDRMDAISPIINAIKNQKGRLHEINYYTETGLYEVPNTDIVYVVWSMIDGKTPIIENKNPNKTYIGLFHGSVSGSKLDNDYELTEADTNVSSFDGCDIVMLGDIHARQGFGSDDVVEIEEILTEAELKRLKDQDGIEILSELEYDQDIQGSLQEKTS